ncbi:putative leucine-rich repeat-containing protein [Tripterygium wilfordii]|uniref:Putative leucine-rich repeat-containing protein n=1 Tax=Tripterygium wilfordii TaxID=458696 RepID=A0A7J7C250_TRIWF|nr:putative leucine-rich repeat-containing protein [Tripterygium wilfordii]
MGIYKTLPPRPSIEEVEAAMSVIKTVNSEEEAKLEEISKQEPPKDVLEEMFYVLKEVKRTMVLFQSFEQKKEALHQVEIDKCLRPLMG